jgi:hypothetical protein
LDFFDRLAGNHGPRRRWKRGRCRSLRRVLMMKTRRYGMTMEMRTILRVFQVSTNIAHAIQMVHVNRQESQHYRYAISCTSCKTRIFPVLILPTAPGLMALAALLIL